MATHGLYNISSTVAGSSANNLLEGVGLGGFSEDNINNPAGTVAHPVLIAHGSYSGTNGMLLLKSTSDYVTLLPDSLSMPEPTPDEGSWFKPNIIPMAVESHAVFVGSMALGSSGLVFADLEAICVEILPGASVTTQWADLSGDLIIDGSLEINLGSGISSSLGDLSIGPAGFLGLVNNPPAANEVISSLGADDYKAPVPEPATLVILTFGACSLIRRKRWKQTVEKA